jgi:uncharacterized protein (DUF1800 family)
MRRPIALRFGAALFVPLILALAAFPAVRPAAALTGDEARHLAARTGFGPTAAEIGALLPLTRAQAVDTLLDGLRTTPFVPPPDWVNGSPVDPDNDIHKQALPGIWYGEMAVTPSPLTERLVLFWHNHFVSSFDKVSAIYMYRQNALFRANAAGSFGSLLHQVARDPAMMLYLDSNSNHGSTPNENFAREMMELFTLGEGNYSETDVREAARAFTGWHVDTKTGIFAVNAKDHDSGSKTVLGQTGKWGGDDVLDIVLQQPVLPSFVAAKFWREFVSPTPNPAELQMAVGAFQSSGLQIKPLLRALLLTPTFWDPANRGSLVKSPTEFVIGTFRNASLPASEIAGAAGSGARMGQALFRPPNVKGWPGYLAWINSETLTVRSGVIENAMHQFKSEVLPQLAPAPGKDVPIAATDVAQLTALLLPLPETYTPRPGAPTLAAVLDYLMHDPAYNLK